VLVMLDRIGGGGGSVVSISALALRGLFAGGLRWSAAGGRWGSSRGIGGGLGFGIWDWCCWYLEWGWSWFFSVVVFGLWSVDCGGGGGGGVLGPPDGRFSFFILV